jgi:sulfatase maturation enzyme AslB (radical SAM superfamily)
LATADRVGIDSAITTNAVLMGDAFVEATFRIPRLRWIKVSLNGGDRDNYAAIHKTKPEDFDKVIRNLAQAVRMREAMGSKVTLGVQMVALPEVEGRTRRSLMHEAHPANVHTALRLAATLRDIGVDYLVIKPYSQHLMSEWTRMYDGVQYKNEDEWLSALENVSTDKFKVVVRRQTMATLADDHRGYDRCPSTPYQWAYLEADGEVWGCSTYLGRVEGDQHYGDDRFRFGNVKELGFHGVWQGERRRANWAYVRDELDTSECRKNCRMHHVNRYLHEVAHPGPHVNFI